MAPYSRPRRGTAPGRSWCFAVVVALAAAAALIVVPARASAGIDLSPEDYVNPDDDVHALDSTPVVKKRAGEILTRAQFPYCRCGRGYSNNPYDLVLSSRKQLKDGRSITCYKVAQVRTCDGLTPGSRAEGCCNAMLGDFHKIEFDADPACAGSVKGVSINGKAGKAWAWVTDLGPSALFKISNLQWNASTAVGSEICYTLGGTCPSMDQLCYNEGGCNFAIFTAGLYSQTVGECCLLGSMELGANNGPGTSPSPSGAPAGGASPAPSPAPGPSPVPSPVVVAKPPPAAAKPPPPSSDGAGGGSTGSLVRVSITVSRRAAAAAPPPPPATRVRSSSRGLLQTSASPRAFDAASCGLLADLVNRRLRALRSPVGWDTPYSCSSVSAYILVAGGAWPAGTTAADLAWVYTELRSAALLAELASALGLSCEDRISVTDSLGGLQANGACGGGSSSPSPSPSPASGGASPAPATGGSSPSPSPTAGGASPSPKPSPSPATGGASPSPSTGGASPSPSPSPASGGASPAPATGGSSPSPSPTAGGASPSPKPSPSPATGGASPSPSTGGASPSPSPSPASGGASPAPATGGSSPSPSPSASGTSPAPSPSPTQARPRVVPPLRHRPQAPAHL
ncbi:hypothetical protein HYH02_003631 [Chlamydomonas schloesseri]|uniref:Pherophorin domain-containing protein n=1 Tax=Chlamydomonas schloesseri TaxID=2026947 RepID=A0A835WQJ3_9CHLO|nr:hypothetical protein HYH02_003631 [Chlamydomonas schloesseri]|eukprot:KAG2451855.1 hypothetical protein HYH02_003631 [Chlamydomonas schloesseri]